MMTSQSHHNQHAFVIYKMQTVQSRFGWAGSPSEMLLAGFCG
jgi:hypothetical protein